MKKLMLFLLSLALALACAGVANASNGSDDANVHASASNTPIVEIAGSSSITSGEVLASPSYATDRSVLAKTNENINPLGSNEAILSQQTGEGDKVAKLPEVSTLKMPSVAGDKSFSVAGTISTTTATLVPVIT